MKCSITMMFFKAFILCNNQLFLIHQIFVACLCLFSIIIDSDKIIQSKKKKDKCILKKTSQKQITTK